METASPKVKILYDGGCKVCDWEVKKYLQADTQGRLEGLDIEDPRFDATQFGLEPAQVRKVFHVVLPTGEVISGVDAFIEIWKALDSPLSRNAARLAKLYPFHKLLELGYAGFVHLRPYLPRKSAVQCSDGRCDLS